jgi:hypothetical protein
MGDIQPLFEKPKRLVGFSPFDQTATVPFQTVPGDLCAGNVFLEPVRTLVEETIPTVSAPPGNSEEFQAHAGFFLCVQKPHGGILAPFVTDTAASGCSP